MFDGSTPSSEPAPFAVGYGNGYGYESLPADHGAATVATTVDQPEPATSTADLGPTLAVTRIDLEPVPTTTVVPTVAAVSHPPYSARPAGSAHPRRRYGRGLVLTSIALLASVAGIGAVVLASSTDVHPVSAMATGQPAAASAPAASDTTIGGQLGRGVDPNGVPLVDLPPVSIIEPTSITRVPAPTTTPVAPTTSPTTTAPTTTSTTSTTTAPTTTTPPTTTPTTTAPTTTTPPTSVTIVQI